MQSSLGEQISSILSLNISGMWCVAKMKNNKTKLTGWSQLKHLECRGPTNHTLTAKPLGPPANHPQTWEPGSTPSWWLLSQSWPGEQSQTEHRLCNCLDTDTKTLLHLDESQRKCLSMPALCVRERALALNQVHLEPATHNAPRHRWRQHSPTYGAATISRAHWNSPMKGGRYFQWLWKDLTPNTHTEADALPE